MGMAEMLWRLSIYDKSSENYTIMSGKKKFTSLSYACYVSVICFFFITLGVIITQHYLCLGRYDQRIMYIIGQCIIIFIR